MPILSLLGRVPRWGWALGAVGLVLCSRPFWNGLDRFRRRAGRKIKGGGDELVRVVFANERSSRPGDAGVPMDRFTSEHVHLIVEYLDRARVSVWLGMYIMTVEAIGEALVRAKRRGVRVRVIGCASMSYSTGSQMSKLAEEDIPIRFNDASSTYLMHHKFCLIDSDWLCARCYHEERVRRLGYCCDGRQRVAVPVTDGLPEGHAMVANGGGGGLVPTNRVIRCDLADARGCVRCRPEKRTKKEEIMGRQGGTEPLPVGGIIITGSANWTMQALNGNWDNMIVTSLEGVVLPFQAEFQRLWAEFARSRKIIEAGGGGGAEQPGGG